MNGEPMQPREVPWDDAEAERLCRELWRLSDATPETVWAVIYQRADQACDARSLKHLREVRTDVDRYLANTRSNAVTPERTARGGDERPPSRTFFPARDGRATHNDGAGFTTPPLSGEAGTPPERGVA